MSLGVIVDERLSWDMHIDEKSKNIFAAVGALKRISLSPVPTF